MTLLTAQVGYAASVLSTIAFQSQAVLIFLSGMANFPPEIYEAAELDGAKWWRMLRSITLPLLRPTLQFVIMLNIMSVFTGMFGFVFIITGGGPGYDTTVL